MQLSEPSFIHLHVHSAYSLAEGAIPVKTLVKKTALMGMPAIAITDSSNLFGAMEFSLEASKAGIQPIIGARVLVGPEEYHLVLLVQSQQGYLNLCELLTQSYVTSDGISKPRLDWDGLRSHAEGLICLSGAVKGPIGQAVLAKQSSYLQPLLDLAVSDQDIVQQCLKTVPFQLSESRIDRRHQKLSES